MIKEEERENALAWYQERCQLFGYDIHDILLRDYYFEDAFYILTGLQLTFFLWMDERGTRTLPKWADSRLEVMGEELRATVTQEVRLRFYMRWGSPFSNSLSIMSWDEWRKYVSRET